MVSRYDSICECMDCVTAFRDNNMEDTDEPVDGQPPSTILDIQGFHSISERLRHYSPDSDHVDKSTQTEDTEYHKNPMAFNI